MVYARWQHNVVDEAGDIQDGATVTVNREVAGAPLASLFSDRAGLVPAGNPITADSEGFAAFHAAGGAYRITATKGAFSRVWRYVAIGTAQELDEDDVLVPGDIGVSVQEYDDDLAALAALASSGLIARTGAGTVAARTITGTSNEISVSNGNGVSGNPTLSLPATIDLGGKTSLEIPNSAAPTVNANGEIAVDTSVTGFSHGILKYFGGEEMAAIAVPVAQLTSPTNGDVPTYNATNDEFELSPASGGGWAEIESGSVSNAAQADVDISGYDLVQIWVTMRPNTDSDNIYIRMSQNGGSSFLGGAGDYSWAVAWEADVATSTADTEIHTMVADDYSNVAAEAAEIVFTLRKPNGAGNHKTLT